MIPLLSESEVRGKKVLLRVDFNVPISGRKVKDDFRIRAHLPTIKKLLGNNNTAILLSHRSEKGSSLRPVADSLSKLIGMKVIFVRDPANYSFDKREARVYLVENLRFWPGEESCSREFAKILAKRGDVFVNDAFAEAHRSVASMILLPKFLPSYLGLLFAKEVKRLGEVMEKPKRPLVAIFGGAKIKTKLKLLQRFSRFADKLIVGGMIANVLLRARGINVGRSFTEQDVDEGIKKIARSKRLVLPTDVVVAPSKESRKIKISSIGEVGERDIIFDIGPRTIKLFAASAAGARSVIWNGPLGLTEMKPFDRGTLGLARFLAKRERIVVVGGGDTVAFLANAGMLKEFKHVSTGGGAMLAYLAGEKLPALEALNKSSKVKSPYTAEPSGFRQNAKLQLKS